MRRLTNQEKKKWGYRFKKSAYKPEVVKQFLESFSQEIKCSGLSYNNNLYRYFYKKLESWSNLNLSITMANKPKKKDVHWIRKEKTLSINKLKPADREFYQELVEDILEDYGVPQDEVVERFKAKKAQAETKKKALKPDNKETNKLKNKRVNNFSNLIKIFNIPRSTFNYKKKPPKILELDLILCGLIEEMRTKSKGIYGYDKIYHNIEEKMPGVYSIWQVRTHYEHLGYRSITKIHLKPTKPKEKKNTKVNIFDLVKGNFKPDKKNEIWFTDVSYIQLSNGKYGYLSIIQDGFNNEIVGWSFSKKNDNDLVMESLRNAINKHKAPKILHSDHGSQYTSKMYIHICRSLNIKISMSRVGVSLDNRPAEYFFNLIKSESLKHLKGIERNFNNIKESIAEYIIWYNESRIQSNLDYKSPLKFRKDLGF